MLGNPALLGVIGPTEWLIIGGIVLLLFGARKLPSLARALGTSINQFKRGLADDAPAELEGGARGDRDGGDKRERG